MKFLHYLADRFLLIVAYYLTALLLLVGVQLDWVVREGVRVSPETELYLGLLATVVLAVFLVWDYARQQSFYRELERLTDAGPLSDMAENDTASVTELVPELREATTWEQRAFARLVRLQHTAFMKQLNEYRERQERHNHFVNRWVHQIKTPVSVIDLLTQQPGEAPLSEDERRLLASIREESDRIAAGLELMLQTARMDRFELDLRPARVSLVQLARNAVNRHKKALIRCAVFPKIEAPDPDLTVETDEKWLGVVLDQLLTNAMKYSKGLPGDKTLLLTAEPAPEGARLRIADKGVGIPPEDLPRVFDPFFTGENGRTGSESTGMGLFLAREICRGLGHRIGIASTPGAGTTVTIEFASRSLYRKVTRM